MYAILESTLSVSTGEGEILLTGEVRVRWGWGVGRGQSSPCGPGGKGASIVTGAFSDPPPLNSFRCAGHADAGRLGQGSGRHTLPDASQASRVEGN